MDFSFETLNTTERIKISAYIFLCKVATLHSFILIISLGGNVCFLSSIFSSGTSKGPPKPWEDPMTYPAIKGYSIYDNNLFVNYTLRCGMRSYVWMTRPSYGDAIHPVEFSRTSVINVDEQSKVISIIFFIDSYWFLFLSFLFFFIIFFHESMIVFLVHEPMFLALIVWQM